MYAVERGCHQEGFTPLSWLCSAAYVLLIGSCGDGRLPSPIAPPDALPRYSAQSDVPLQMHVWEGKADSMTPYTQETKGQAFIFEFT
jgi:hypothetical protein